MEFLFWIFTFTCFSYRECVPIQEPRCSKFDFEEKVLEKMVRMDHANELMMNEFKELAASVKDSLEAMKDEFDDIKHQVQEELEKYKIMVQDYLDRPSYAFSAYWLSNHDADVGDTLIFKNILLNEYNAYNNYTGEYTVQLSGTYMFSSTLCFDANNYASIEFVANDKSVGIFRVGDRDWSMCSSSSLTYYLQKDTRVKLVVRYRYKTSVFWDETNKGHCSFAGHLIQ